MNASAHDIEVSCKCKESTSTSGFANIIMRSEERRTLSNSDTRPALFPCDGGIMDRQAVIKVKREVPHFTTGDGDGEDGYASDVVSKCAAIPFSASA